MESGCFGEAYTAQNFCFGDNSFTVKTKRMLHNLRLTVYCLELEEPRFGLPETVIVKEEKLRQKDEFCHEIAVYGMLRERQGTVIPTLFVQGSFNGRPALILSNAEGFTLRDLAKVVESSVPEKTLEIQLQEAFKKLHKYGAEHCDLSLGNFLLCNNGQVVVLELEEVDFRDRHQA